MEDQDVTLDVIWGDDGCADIRVLMKTVKDLSGKIESQMSFLEDLESGSKSKLDRLWSKMRNKDTEAFKAEQDSLLTSTEELEQLIGQLCHFSDIVFDSAHPPTTETVIHDPLGTDSSKLMEARIEASELFRICSMSPLDCFLEIGLRSEQHSQSLSSIDVSIPSVLQMKPTYHLITRDFGAPPMLQEVIIKEQREGDSRSPLGTVLDINQPDGPSLGSRWTSNVIEIQSQRAGLLPQSQVAQSSSAINCEWKDESLAQILELDQRAGTATCGAFKHFHRVELAFRLAQCGFYLLGTPWLAGLNKQRVRRLGLGSQHHSWVLANPLTEIEYLLQDDPDALVETTHLFRIGVLLLDIALDHPDHLEPSSRRGRI